MSEIENPWKTLSTRAVYHNDWISISEHQVTDPSGNPGLYGVVSFNNAAVGIIPLDDEMNTWIVGQYRYALDEYSWEIPMGGAPLDSSPLATAQRELKEETGLTAGHWQQILQVHLSNSVTDEKGLVFVAENLTPGDTAFESTEQLEIRRLPFSELLEMVLQGEITDALSIVGVMKLAAIRGLFPPAGMPR